MARRSEHYDRALKATRDVVNSHDPIGLIDLGAPSDEYDPEVADLVRAVLADRPIDEETVDEVWVRWFGDEYRSTGTRELAALTADLRKLQTHLDEQ